MLQPILSPAMESISKHSTCVFQVRVDQGIISLVLKHLHCVFEVRADQGINSLVLKHLHCVFEVKSRTRHKFPYITMIPQCPSSNFQLTISLCSRTFISWVCLSSCRSWIQPVPSTTKPYMKLSCWTKPSTCSSRHHSNYKMTSVVPLISQPVNTVIPNCHCLPMWGWETCTVHWPPIPMQSWTSWSQSGRWQVRTAASRTLSEGSSSASITTRHNTPQLFGSYQSQSILQKELTIKSVICRLSIL